MFSSMNKKASEGDFIKDLGTQKRSLGIVMSIDKKTNIKEADEKKPLLL